MYDGGDILWNTQWSKFWTKHTTVETCPQGSKFSKYSL